MKKIILLSFSFILPIVVFGQGYQNGVGIYGKFPFTHVSSKLVGTIECQPTITYDASYRMMDPQGCGEEKYGYVQMLQQLITPTADTANFYSWMDMREASSSLANTNYKLVYAQIASEPRYPSGRPRLRLIDFYIAEFYDPATNLTLAFEYGSKWGTCGECGMDKKFCTSIFLREDRIEYCEPQYKGKTTEVKMFEAANGAYLYELRNKDGKAVGIRYYCTNNRKEYIMFFR